MPCDTDIGTIRHVPDHVVVVYSQFLYRYKQTQSAKTRFRQAGARQSSQRLSQQVNKCSEVKYGVVKVEVKVRKEQAVRCTGVRRGQRAYTE